MMLNVFDDYKVHQVMCEASAELKANTLMQKMTWLMEQAGPHQPDSVLKISLIRDSEMMMRMECMTSLSQTDHR